MARKTKARPGGATFTRGAGFYTEGRYFGKEPVALEHACAFAASLAEEYGRGVAVETALSTGHATRVLLYVPKDGAEALVARRDQYGHVITC